MKQAQQLVFLSMIVAVFACSKSDDSTSVTPTPEEDLTTPVAGIYKLTKLTTRNGGPAVTGTGSLTIVAVDKTTANITQVRSLTNTSTGATAIIESVKNEANKIAKDGSNYIIKSTNGTQWATISGSKISTADQISTTPTTSLTVDTEYTK